MQNSCKWNLYTHVLMGFYFDKYLMTDEVKWGLNMTNSKKLMSILEC